MRAAYFSIVMSIALLSGAERDARAATFTGLGDLAGGAAFSVGTAISADGSTVVGRSGVNGGNMAFRWTSAGGMVGLGHIAGGTDLNEAWGVSGDGAVVVGYSDGASGREAFRWTAAGGMVGLDGPAHEYGPSEALAISDNGLVAVGKSAYFGGDPELAVVWRGTATSPTYIDYLDSATPSGVARGVSADGSVIVGSGVGVNGTEAFRWTGPGDGTALGLGDLAGGTFSSAANDVSADGSVIVGSSRSANGVEAFRWTSAGGMQGLGDLAGGGFSSIAEGVSASGGTIVGQSISGSGLEAFIWTQAGGGMLSLRDVLVTQYGLGAALSGWTLTNATGISDDGLVITGFGSNGGRSEAFVVNLRQTPVVPVDIPEPATALLAAASVAALARARRRDAARG